MRFVIEFSADAEADFGLKSGTVDLKSAGPLAFGPNGILLIGDPLGAAIYAVDTGDHTMTSGPAYKMAKVEDRSVTPEELAGASLARPFAFTKGAPVLKVPVIERSQLNLVPCVAKSVNAPPSFPRHKTIEKEEHVPRDLDRDNRRPPNGDSRPVPESSSRGLRQKPGDTDLVEKTFRLAKTPEHDLFRVVGPRMQDANATPKKWNGAVELQRDDLVRCERVCTKHHRGDREQAGAVAA